jgi:hypothetical protein
VPSPVQTHLDCLLTCRFLLRRDKRRLVRFRGQNPPSMVRARGRRGVRKVRLTHARASETASFGGDAREGLKFGRYCRSPTYVTTDLRPAAVCRGLRAACTETPDIILRAPKVTWEVETAGATAARAATRVRRIATGARATKGAEMVIAAIVCGWGMRNQKWARQVGRSSLFASRLQEKVRQAVGKFAKTCGGSLSLRGGAKFGESWGIPGNFKAPHWAFSQ